MSIVNERITRRCWILMLCAAGMSSALGQQQSSTAKPQPVRKIVVTCPGIFDQIGDYCYYFSNDTTSWNSAFEECARMNSNLALLDNEVKAKRLKDHLTNRETSGNRTEKWIDGKYYVKAKVWKLRGSDSTMTYRDFGPGIDETIKPTRKCIAMNPDANYTWRTDGCRIKKQYICEVEAKKTEQDNVYPRSAKHHSTAQRNISRTCPVGFDLNKVNCFHISNQSVSWSEAKLKCKNMNSTLAIPKSRNKHRSLRTFLKKQTALQEGERWIDGQYNSEEFVWKWGGSGNNITKYQNFVVDASASNASNCIIIDHKRNYKWGRRNCSEKKLYICEVPADLLGEQKQEGMADDSTNKQNVTISSDSENRVTNDRRQACPAQFDLVHESCCYISENMAPRWEANYQCGLKNSQLLALNNKNKYEYLKRELMEKKNSSLDIWTSGWYNETESVAIWGWSSEIITNISNFGALASQPKYTNVSHCVMMDSTTNYQWIWERCDKTAHYICEVPPTITGLAEDNDQQQSGGINADFGYSMTNSRARTNFTCPEGFRRINKICYYFSKDFADWRGAAAGCRSTNSELLTPNNKNKNKFFKHKLMGKNRPQNGTWTSGRYDSKSGNWTWQHSSKNVLVASNVEPFNFSAPEESHGQKYECIAMNADARYKWEKRDCGDRYRYICEVPATIKGEQKQEGMADDSTKQQNVSISSDSENRVTNDRRQACPAEFNLVHESCYYFSKNVLPRWQAHNQCKQKESQLLALNDKNQYESLKRELMEKNNYSFNIWTNGWYNKTGSVTIWESSSEIITETSNFGALAPRHKDMNVNFCIMMDSTTNYQWIWQNCHTYAHYICEVPPTVTDFSPTKMNQTRPN